MSSNEDQPDDGASSLGDVEELMSRPLRVTSVKIHGGKTKTYLVFREFSPIRKARTVAEVVKAAEEACNNLTALGIYDAVQIVLDEGDPVRIP
jgi:hypothetical protein